MRRSGQVDQQLGKKKKSLVFSSLRKGWSKISGKETEPDQWRSRFYSRKVLASSTKPGSGRSSGVLGRWSSQVGSGGLRMDQRRILLLLMWLDRWRKSWAWWNSSKDDKKNGPGDQEPNIFVTKKDALGENEYDRIHIFFFIRTSNFIWGSGVL